MIACGEVAKLCDAFVDRELLAEARVKIVRHLWECDACKSLVEMQRRIKQRVQASVGNLPAPASLRVRIQMQMGA